MQHMGRLLVCLLVSMVNGWRDSRPRMVVDYLKEHAGNKGAFYKYVTVFLYKFWTDFLLADVILEKKSTCLMTIYELFYILKDTFFY